MQTQHQHHTPHFKHHTPRFYIIFHAPSTQHPSSSLQRHLPRNYQPSNGTIERASCGDIPRGMDGEAARFPARNSRANSAMVRDRREFPPKPGKKRKNTPHCSEVPLEQHLPRFFSGCKKKEPVTLTREGGVSAPDWRKEVEHAQKGGGARGQGVANGREAR